MTGMVFKRPSPLQKHLNELITKLKNSNDFKHYKKIFKEFIDKKDRGPQLNFYYLHFDLDELKFKIASELDITYNTLVLVRGVVPSKKELKEEKRIEDYQFEWSLEKKK